MPAVWFICKLDCFYGNDMQHMFDKQFALPPGFTWKGFCVVASAVQCAIVTMPHNAGKEGSFTVLIYLTKK